jgi:FkbM family methyltransferase
MGVRQQVQHLGGRVARRAGLGDFIDAYRASKLPENHRRDLRDRDHMELLIGLFLREDSNCIDVGASVGDILRMILARAPQGEHYAFEPIPSHAAALRDAFPNVQVLECALANERGQAEFTWVEDASPYSGLRPHEYPNPNWTKTKIEVKVDRLDDVIPADYTPSFIKIDVEGGEADVLAGGIETIKRSQPLVIFEHCDWGDPSAPGPSGTYPLLAEEAGLEVFDIDGHGPLTLKDMQEIYDLGEIGTFVAMPAGRELR